MKCVKYHFSGALMGVATLTLLCSGCQQEASTAPPVAANAKLTPEQSFEQIANRFTRSVQTGAGGVDAGFMVREDDGHSRLAIRNEVAHEVIPPSKPGEPYRGVITVTSQRDFSIQRIGRSTDSDSGSDDSDQGNQGGFSADDQGVSVFDNDLVKSSTNERRGDSRQSDDMIARLSDEDVSTYELEYENNRWVLKTELDPETERSIENAFNHVLSLQP